MTNTSTSTSTPESPKQSSWKKKFFWIVAIVLGALGIDHYTFHYVSGGVDVAVTVTDSTVVATANVDTTITLVTADSTKVDTTKK